MKENCSKCGTPTTLVRNKRTYWYRDKDGKRLCRWCYLVFIANPKRNFKTMRFKGKATIFPFKVRVGQCVMIGCNNTRTDRHHIEYVACFPIAMTVELCDSHHSEENSKQGQLQSEYYFDWSKTTIQLVSS